MPRHSCCEVRVMQLHDILLLRTSAILPEAISAGGLTPTTDTSLFLTTYRGGRILAIICWRVYSSVSSFDGIISSKSKSSIGSSSSADGSSTGASAIPFPLPLSFSRNGKYFFPYIRVTTSVGKVLHASERPISIRSILFPAYHPSFPACEGKLTGLYVPLCLTSFLAFILKRFR